MDERMRAAVAATESMYREGDFARVESLLSPGIVIDWSNSIGPYRGVYRGLEEARGFFATFVDAFAEVEWHASRLVAIGDQLAMAGNVSARGRTSGAESTSQGGQAWTFDGDRVAAIKLFQSREEAIRWIRVERLSGARLYFVCDGRPYGDDPGALLDAALRGGVDILQLRDKDLANDELVAAAAPFRAAARNHGALFILNDRPELVAACDADGVHVGQDDTPVAEARRITGEAALVGLSTHSPAQFDAAVGAKGDSRPDQVSVGPVWATPTKPGRPAAGLELITRAAERSSKLPWFAIGGIDAGNVGEVVRAGAERVVVVRAIRDAEDPEAAARSLSAVLGRERVRADA